MPPPSVHTHLLVGAWLLTLLPALYAADNRATGFQTQAPQTASPIPSEQGSQSVLSGGKNLSEDEAGRRFASDVSPAQSQRPQVSSRAARPISSAQNDRAQRLSTSLNVQDVIINTYPGAPFTILRTFEGTRMIVQFLPLTPSRVGVPPLHPARIMPPARAHAPFIAAVLGENAPLVASAPTARSTLPALTFASPVPGKPGCVYPPGAQRIPANIVDVTGQHPGTRMRDPVTKVIFLVP